MARHRDVLLALAFAVWGVAGAFVSHVEGDRWVVALAGLPIAAALVWRRTAPRAVAAALFVGWVATYQLELVPAWGITSELIPPIALFGIAAYMPSSRAPVRHALGAGAVFGGGAIYFAWRDAPPFYTWVGLYVFPLAAMVGAIAAGLALRDRAAELDAARARLRAEERSTSEADRLDAARMAIAREIHGHLTVRIDAISRHVSAARAALEVGATVAWVATMRAIQDAASAAMHGLRATLMVLGDARDGSATQEGAGTLLRSLSELDGVARGPVQVRVTVEGQVPEPLRALATLARRIATDGVELLLAHARGPARAEVVATADGVVLRFSADGGWWRAARSSVERARLVETAQLSGQVSTPRPWRPALVVRLPARPAQPSERLDAWRDRVARARRIWMPFNFGMRPAAALLPVGLLVLLGVLEVVAVDGVKAQDAVRLAGALLAPLPFLYRARAPLAVACAVTALLLGRQLVGDLGTPTISQNFFQYVAMFVVGAYSRTVAGAIAGWIVVFGGALGAILYEGVDYPGDAYVFFTVANFAAAAAGVSVRRRIRQAAELERVRSQLARQRREAVAAAVAGERMNVARELHDVVGHSVTVMAVQAGAALALAGRDPAAARAAAESVVEYESVVGAELGQLLRALRSDGGSVTPTRLADVVELVERSRRAGLPVRFESDGDLSVVAPWLIATAYRIVQEALTNVRRHAGDAPTCVSVRVDPSLLRVEVRNDRGTAAAARPGSGAGIAGMRERTVVHGGAFEAGETPDGGWCVSALLPVGEREPAPA